MVFLLNVLDCFFNCISVIILSPYFEFLVLCVFIALFRLWLLFWGVIRFD